MLITILAAGTRGDTQPYIALGLELKKSDHHVLIATFENDETSILSVIVFIKYFFMLLFTYIIIFFEEKYEGKKRIFILY